jgi:hypothetical protein
LQFYKSESVDERTIRENDERYRQRHEHIHELSRNGQSIRDT